MEKRKTGLMPQHPDEKVFSPDADSKSREDDHARAFKDGVAAADAAFGNFRDLLSKEMKRRKK